MDYQGAVSFQGIQNGGAGSGGADNGLHIDGGTNKVYLGGTLVEDTTVDVFPAQSGGLKFLNESDGTGFVAIQSAFEGEQLHIEQGTSGKANETPWLLAHTTNGGKQFFGSMTNDAPDALTRGEFQVQAGIDTRASIGGILVDPVIGTAAYLRAPFSKLVLRVEDAAKAIDLFVGNNRHVSVSNAQNFFENTEHVFRTPAVAFAAIIDNTKFEMRVPLNVVFDGTCFIKPASTDNVEIGINFKNNGGTTRGYLTYHGILGYTKFGGAAGYRSEIWANDKKRIEVNVTDSIKYYNEAGAVVGALDLAGDFNCSGTLASGAGEEWDLGARTAGAVALDATHYVGVTVNGVFCKLLIAT